jgi:hypothetical protein
MCPVLRKCEVEDARRAEAREREAVATRARQRIEDATEDSKVLADSAAERAELEKRRADETARNLRMKRNEVQRAKDEAAAAKRRVQEAEDAAVRAQQAAADLARQIGGGDPGHVRLCL